MDRFYCSYKNPTCQYNEHVPASGDEECDEGCSYLKEIPRNTGDGATSNELGYGVWVSVSDRLPEKSGYVLTVHENCLPFITMYLKDGYFKDTFPTHWMPLPRAPQKKC